MFSRLNLSAKEANFIPEALARAFPKLYLAIVIPEISDTLTGR
jgi:hypothetical protein